jgi:hypothetical protein
MQSENMKNIKCAIIMEIVTKRCILCITVIAAISTFMRENSDCFPQEPILLTLKPI